MLCNTVHLIRRHNHSHSFPLHTLKHKRCTHFFKKKFQTTKTKPKKNILPQQQKIENINSFKYFNAGLVPKMWSVHWNCLEEEHIHRASSRGGSRNWNSKICKKISFLQIFHRKKCKNLQRNTNFNFWIATCKLCNFHIPPSR